jgi:hypothetical protein
MNLFEKAKKEKEKATKPCAWCRKEFRPDPKLYNWYSVSTTGNEKRGWAKCCSKSCAVSLRNRLFNMTHEEQMAEIRDIKLRELGL